MPRLFNTTTQVTVLIEITLQIIFMGLYETAVLSEVKVIHKQKGPITFTTSTPILLHLLWNEEENPKLSASCLEMGRV